MKNESICAVVVTYNRKKLLMECLDSLENQSMDLDAIYIVDNASTDNTPQLLFKTNYINVNVPEQIKKPWENTFQKGHLSIHYLRMHQNLGGSGGFYEGLKRAYAKKYDWFWIMDDDSEPCPDALERLSEYLREDKVSALANLKLDNKMNLLNLHVGYFDFKKSFPMIKPITNSKLSDKTYLEVDMSSFVGILVNGKAIGEIGFPHKNFFIYHDDVEYCIRLRTFGRILLVVNSIIIHKEFNVKNKIGRKFLGKTYLRPTFDSFWAEYFDKRNLTWLGRRYTTNILYFYINLMISCLKGVIKIVLVDDYKFRRIKLLLNAYWDGLKGNFDNYKAKKILYDK